MNNSGFREPLDFIVADLQCVQQRLKKNTVILQENVFKSLKKGDFILSHNGIICTKRDMKYSRGVKQARFFSIIMLKDKYRPMISLSRDRVEQLNFETACALSILEKMVPMGVLRGEQDNLITKTSVGYISLKRYQQLLADHPEWEMMLRFNTKAGKITAEELKSKIDENGSFTLSAPRGYLKKELYSELCFAYLRSNYALYLYYEEAVYPRGTKIFIIVKKKNEDKMENVVFPPSFCFELSEDGPQYDMVKKCIKINGFCNKEHRLVKFLEKNSKILEDKVPGLWNKMLRILIQEDGTALVREVNLILDDLRRITELEIPIPDYLFLSNADVI